MAISKVNPKFGRGGRRARRRRARAQHQEHVLEQQEVARLRRKLSFSDDRNFVFIDCTFAVST